MIIFIPAREVVPYAAGRASPINRSSRVGQSGEH
jgi:hypothetical protein